MPVLFYSGVNQSPSRHEFSEQPVRIGSDPGRNELVLPADLDVAPAHAIITPAGQRHLYVLVDLLGRHVWVNHQRVIHLKVLYQGDQVQLGQATLRFHEVLLLTVEEDSAFLGEVCPVDEEPFEVGQDVIPCPHCYCHTQYHRDCWFSQPRCSRRSCGYLIHDTIMDALAPWVQFERKLEKEAPLLKGQKSCPAGNLMDQVAFQPGQQTASCPSCQTPFHLVCWLTLRSCPVCRYEIDALIRRVFCPQGASWR